MPPSTTEIAPAITEVTTHDRLNHSLRSDRWRYIRYNNGSEELYDHRNDPYEWTNLAADEAHAAKKQELRDKLMSIVDSK